MFDLSGAGPQTGGGDSVIPNGTFAVVQVAVKQPKPDMVSSAHPMVTAGKTGSQYIELELTVIGTVDPNSGQLTPKYAKKKIWDKIGLQSGPEAQQRARSNGKDPEAWAKAGKATWLALLQASANINPKDMAQHADKFTNIGPESLHGLTVPIKIGVDDPKPTPQNQNPRKSNRISFVITPDAKEYGAMMAGQSQGGGQAPAPQQGGGWGGQPAQQPQQPANQGGNGWGGNGGGQPPAQSGNAWGNGGGQPAAGGWTA